MCSCLSIIRIHLEKSDQMSESGFFLSRSHIGWDLGFSSKIGRILMKSEWLNSLRTYNFLFNHIKSPKNVQHKN